MRHLFLETSLSYRSLHDDEIHRVRVVFSCQKKQKTSVIVFHTYSNNPSLTKFSIVSYVKTSRKSPCSSLRLRQHQHHHHLRFLGIHPNMSSVIHPNHNSPIPYHHPITNQLHLFPLPLICRRVTPKFHQIWRRNTPNHPKSMPSFCISYDTSTFYYGPVRGRRPRCSRVMTTIHSNLDTCNLDYAPFEIKKNILFCPIHRVVGGGRCNDNNHFLEHDNQLKIPNDDDCMNTCGLFDPNLTSTVSKKKKKK